MNGSPGRGEITFDTSYFTAREAGTLRSAQAVVPIVQRLIQPESVVDIGCGLGTWLAEFVRRGVDDVVGIDGPGVDPAALVIPGTRFETRDLRYELRLDRRFGLALSLEVAHYLPPDRAGGFVDDLVRLAPAVLFSAAVPFQGGDGHRNEHWQDEWADLFCARNYVPIDVVRPAVWDDPSVDVWYAQNALLFVERALVGSTPRLCAAAAERASLPLRLVHPALFLKRAQENASLRAVARECARAPGRRLAEMARRLRPGTATQPTSRRGR